MHPHTFHIAPYDEDPVRTLVKLVLDKHQQALPDLTQVVILLPDMHAASRIRQLLLREANALNYPALLGPHITTLKQWIINQSRQLTHQPVSHYCQELILYDALVKHPDLYGKGNPWTLTNELLVLFDELNLNQTK